MTRLRLSLLTLLCAISFAPGAHAQTTDVSTILETCLADNPDNKRTCIGKASSACMATDEGQSTLGMANCADLETRWWDARLNDTYGKLRKSLEPASFKALRDAQRKWLAFRDADCQWVYDHQFGTGSLRIPVSGLCIMDATALRALYLETLLLEQ